MVSRQRLCLAVLLLCLSAASLAQEPDGNSLLRQCRFAMDSNEGQTGAERMGGAYCLGMVRGIYALNDYYVSLDRAVMCPPRDVSLSRLVEVVVSYLSDNPAQLHEPDTALAVLALQSAFPCP
jgi:hypothetical protein